MYKVFINDKVIYFTNNKDLSNNLTNCLIINFFADNLIDEIYNLLKKEDKVLHLIINTEDTENAFTIFKNHYRLIKAAGGWVRNRDNKSLFIFRLGKWDLPKGKLEKEETSEVAAIREVQEECGIDKLNIVKKLPDTFHMYEMKNEVILKQSFWYEMITDFDGKLIPQLEEDITDAEWLTAKEIDSKVLTNTYASIKELINFTSH